MLGLSASLLAGERASKDTSPLGPDEVAADPSMLYIHWRRISPLLEKCKSSDPNVITILLLGGESNHITGH